MKELAHLREDYARDTLRQAEMAADPLHQFTAWFTAAKEAGIKEPNAMTLATVDAEGFPNSRVVLLKDLQDGQFTFFTNYSSQKAQELAHGKQAASLTFLWHELERQIHVRGTVARVSTAESDAYFSKRPYLSQIGAWASAQSTPVASRTVLEDAFASLKETYPEGQPVPRPPHWGGFALTPFSVEFWQGRRSRLHDRLRYSLENGTWTLRRFSP